MNIIKLLFENFISILSLILSIIALICTYKIYRKQKIDDSIISFYSIFSEFLADATKNNNDAHIILIKLKLKATFLDREIFEEFIKILPRIEKLNLTDSNPERKEDWDCILNFLTISSNFYNNTLNKDLIKIYLHENL